MHDFRVPILLWLLMTGLSGCAAPPPSITSEPAPMSFPAEPPPVTSPTPRATFVLLPDQDGRIGRIEVSNPQGSQVLHAPGEATLVATADSPPSAPVSLSDQQVAQMFGPVLAALPPPPLHFTLYFDFDSAELTPQARQLIPRIIAVVTERGSVDTSLVGHTDTVGSKTYNYDLGRRRAGAVARLLTLGHVAPSSLELLSRGEDDPAVPTADEVAEPRNRRVEVTIR